MTAWSGRGCRCVIKLPLERGGRRGDDGQAASSPRRRRQPVLSLTGQTWGSLSWIVEWMDGVTDRRVMEESRDWVPEWEVY